MFPTRCRNSDRLVDDGQALQPIVGQSIEPKGPIRLSD
ncbi:hypothetical protein OHAE_5247 [Ochrobactrum soli]|uniref:Uncharacterized protein n=1 Tax=Ochrobactrum soli TaxID=2448455 RepID=A0A2P9HFQ8_9HYPH|nr:hypothetical protein OHAE_5247 [[Ochrobactrum] soli]